MNPSVNSLYPLLTAFLYLLRAKFRPSSLRLSSIWLSKSAQKSVELQPKINLRNGFMKQAIEIRITEMIRLGRWGIVTRPLSWFYALMIRIRHWLYDKRWLASKYAPLPVVSIGNLVVGGVGKTQVALLLARSIEGAAIASRGFRGKVEKSKDPLVVLTEHLTPEVCGDEPWLLASRLPERHVIVNRDRYRAALEAKKLGARVLLLDDGMQHRRLFRNFEIVVLSGSDPFGGGHFLPRGFLREDPKRLAQADLVVFVGKPSASVEKKVTALTLAPCVQAEICIKQVHGLPSLKEAKVGLFCGIGNPNRFVASMEKQGASVVASHFLPDHKSIGLKELQTFAALCKARGADAIFCTEKDKVKLPKYEKTLALPLGWVAVELEIVENQEAWDRLKNEITQLAGIKR